MWPVSPLPGPTPETQNRVTETRTQGSRQDDLEKSRPGNEPRALLLRDGQTERGCPAMEHH